MPDGTNIVEGQGCTLGFASSSVVVNIIDVNYSGITRSDVLISDQGTTGLERYIPSTLAEGGTITFAINHNMQDQSALYTLATSADPENITITYPNTVDTATTDQTDVFLGYVNSYTKVAVKGSPINGQLVIKVADDLTATDEVTP